MFWVDVMAHILGDATASPMHGCTDRVKLQMANDPVPATAGIPVLFTVVVGNRSEYFPLSRKCLWLLKRSPRGVQGLLLFGWAPLY